MGNVEGGLRVLIAEDEVLIAMDMELIVETAGHRVLDAAADFDELAALDVGRMPQVAFVDVQLRGGSSGLDAATYIRATWPDAVIVFVTANPRMVGEGVAMADAVIAKPFTPLLLTRALAFLDEGIADPPPAAALPRGLAMRATLGRRFGMDPLAV